MIPEPTEASIRIARDTVSRDPIFKTTTDIHGRAIESAIYRMANSEVARCYLRLVAAREPEADKLRDALEDARTANGKLIAWLYDACDGFPVSQEAFDAFTADDLKAVGASIANRTDEQFTSLDEFKARVTALSRNQGR